MKTEEEFKCWLDRPEKHFVERFQFALKVWQSAEFPMRSKYSIILSWLTASAPKYCMDIDMQTIIKQFEVLFQLQGQSGFVQVSIKSNLVELLLLLAVKWQKEHPESLNHIGLLKMMLDWPFLYNFFCSDYDSLARVYALIFEHYEKYINIKKSQESGVQFQSVNEVVFITSIIDTLKETASRSSSTCKFEKSYTKFILEPFVKVLLVLRQYKLCFFEDLLLLEKTLCGDMIEEDILERNANLPLCVRLLTTECSIVNRRGVEVFLNLLLEKIFDELLQEEKKNDTALALTVAAYVMKMLHKHEINLSFRKIKDEPVVKFMGKKILKCVTDYKNTHPTEVLMLLCATLRLNPLILEKEIFQIATWMIVSKKSGEQKEKLLFENFLDLLMEMFRRLSRADKFVVNLLKAIKEWLQNNNLQSLLGKRSANDCEGLPSKRQKLENANDKIISKSASFTIYEEILFHDFQEVQTNSKETLLSNTSVATFPKLDNHWPSNRAGVRFSNLISGLLSKTSITIWKTLVYSIKELLKSLQDETASLNENTLFQLDFSVALLCEYLASSRLTEQYDKFFTEINDMCRLTNETLGQFGRFLLSCEHNKRTMTAFLECSYQTANFLLLLTHYRPDEMPEDLQVLSSNKSLHAYLTEEEWTLLQQRILNFGKTSCNYLLNRLHLQRTEAENLMFKYNIDSNLQKSLISSVLNNKNELEKFLQTPNVTWIIPRLTREKKIDVINQFLQTKPDLIENFTEDQESMEFIILSVCERVCIAFKTASKNSVLSNFNCDFSELRKSQDAKILNKHLRALVEVIMAAEHNHKLKKLPHTEIENNLMILKKLPIGQLRRQFKSLIFALLLAFYRDLIAAKAADSAKLILALIKDLFHFGHQVPVFKYFTIDSMLKMFEVSTNWELYELLFSTVEDEEKGSSNCLVSLLEILKTAYEETHKLSEDHEKLLLKTIETLSAVTGPSAKRLRKQRTGFLQIFGVHVNKYFEENPNGNDENDRLFANKTVASFALYANVVLTAKDEEQPLGKIDENFRRIYKIYIGHSLDYRNSHVIRLMQTALNHRQKLHLDQDEIEVVLSHYWRQLNEDLKSTVPSNVQAIENVIKLIISYKTDEDLVLMLQEIAANITENNVMNLLRLLTCIAKCPFSTIKGAIFNSHFNWITQSILLLFNERLSQLSDDIMEFILSILSCQNAVVANKTILMTKSTIDSIIHFMTLVNIKKRFVADVTNERNFYNLHRAMTELCTVLIKVRDVLIMDRITVFLDIFLHLLQVIICYKSNRQKDAALSPTEINDLAALLFKMEMLINITASHGIHVKRVAPFLLVLLINIMVTAKRPTTLYPKLKEHVDNICYALIGICDHRSARFILRSSNEAARQVYETLAKDYTKYCKFTGKV